MEAIYKRAVGLELEADNIAFELEKSFPVTDRAKSLYVHRLDLVIENGVLLELKAVERLHPVHRAQVLSCLRVSRLRVALLINFNVAVLSDGIKRIVLSLMVFLASCFRG